MHRHGYSPMLTLIIFKIGNHIHIYMYDVWYCLYILTFMFVYIMFLWFYYMLIYRVYRHRCRGIGPEASDRKWNPCNGTRPALGSCLCGKAVKCTIHDTDGPLKDNCNLQKCNWLDSLLFSRFTDKFTIFNCKFLWSQYLWPAETLSCLFAQMRTFSAADSQFFGGGMQNAYSYDHTGKLILIQEPGDYDGCWTIRKLKMILQ